MRIFFAVIFSLLSYKFEKLAKSLFNSGWSVWNINLSEIVALEQNYFEIQQVAAFFDGFITKTHC